MKEEFYFNVYGILNEIPIGCVATYKLIAQLSNHPNNARLVGTALRCASIYGEFPCHRVVHTNGSLVIGWDEQQQQLQQEGITFLKNGNVDMKKHLWDLKTK